MESQPTRGSAAALRRVAGTALAAALALPGCDLSWNFRSDDGKTSVRGRSGGGAATAGALALEPLPADRTLSTRAGSEVVLRFSAPLDPASARGAVRVHERGRPGEPLPVLVETRGADLLLRPPAGRPWRPGGVLVVGIAGMPSLRALRSAEGTPLGADAEVRVTVRMPRSGDRSPPVLEATVPAPGATGVDPAAPLILDFSEPMDASVLNVTARGTAWDPLRLEVDGRLLPFRAFLDRTRRRLTVLPSGGLPPEAAVVLEIGDRCRDAAGNGPAPDSPRTLAFRTGPGRAAGLLAEAFEDQSGMDPLGTTVRWDHPAARGVVEGVLEPRALETGRGAGDQVLLLDPRGGTLRVLVPVEELGDEPRVLKALHLVVAPGAAGGEVLDPRVRLAPAPGAVSAAEPVDPAAFGEATEGLRGAAARGPGVVPLVFRHPYRYDGFTPVLVEVSWSGTTGAVYLRASRAEGVRTLLEGWGPEPQPMALAPVFRLETVGLRAVARSRWMDAGAAFPDWGTPVLHGAPDASPPAIRLQGAPAGADGEPDLSRATPWTGEPGALAGMRWIRFRLIFGEDAPGDPPAVLDRLDLPFTAR